MFTYEDFFTQILGIPSPTFDPLGFLLGFVIPLIVIWYAFYLLIERISHWRNSSTTVLALVLAFPTLRFGGNIALWIGLAGILGLRVRGITSKAMGIAVVFAMFSYSQNLTLATLPTVLALFGVLFVLMKPWSLGTKIFALVPIYFTWYAFRSWQIASVVQLLPALFSFFGFLAWMRLSGWKRYVAIVGIILAYFLIVSRFSFPLLSLPST